MLAWSVVVQTVQRAEFWGAIVALQCHLGIDNLNVCS